MPEGTRNCKKQDGQSKEKEIVAEHIIRLFLDSLPGVCCTPTGSHQHQNRTENVNEYDKTPWSIHCDILHFLKAISKKAKDGTRIR